jgi:anaerobic selenocysteine-containing dehydrogenase
VAVAADADPALVDAVMSLNALIGAFDRPGGIFAAPLPTVPAERAAVATEVPPARIVALRDASILRSLSMPASLFETIERAEFVVSFSPYLDEAAEAADLLMPMHTPLESWQAVLPPPAARAESIALSRPATQARLATRDLGELLSATAAAVGGALATACDWTSTDDLVKAEIARLGHERRGTPYATPYQTEWIGLLEHGGWWIPSAASPEAFATAVLDAGGWLDPAFEPGEILKSLDAREGLSFVLPAAIAALNDEGQPSPGAEYPLLAMAFTPAVVDLLGGHNHPSLFELLGQPDGVPWQPWMEMSLDTARTLEIQPRTRVRVASPYGTIEVVAVLADGARADRVAIAHVPVVPAGGRWARTSEVDVRRLWPRGRSAIGTVPVRVTKV